MDFDSPDVEKDFPGLYASESGSGSGRKKDEDDFSEGDHEKISKKELLLGRRKDKKDKKDRGYATLDGESSPEEELDVKSPSKSAKKSKAFKFPSKNKEKREKSRDKEIKDKDYKDVNETKEKKKDKDKKEKEKKEKNKDKDKKDKKSKQGSVSEERMDLGDAQPIFGVSLGLAVERSRCHDYVNLPLIARDCIDYLQEYGLQSEQIYKTETVKQRLQQLKKLYNNRESGIADFDIPTACGLLKLYLKELPEPILTTDLSAKFEEAASLSQVAQQEQALLYLIKQLPGCHRTLLAWMTLHLNAILKNETYNKINAQCLAMLLSTTMQMSNRLLIAILCHSSKLFPNVKLHKYIPPITSSSPNLPETPNKIVHELSKQESLLNQIHAEMNAGFVSKKREEQLWEVQRIITQLKRKLRSFEKKQDSTQKSLDDTVFDSNDMNAMNNAADNKLPKKNQSHSDDENQKNLPTVSTITETSTNIDINTSPLILDNVENSSTKLEIKATTEINKMLDVKKSDKLYVNDNGLFMLPDTHSEHFNLLRLQLVNNELLKWKTHLQKRINTERMDILQLQAIIQSNGMHLENIRNEDEQNALLNSSSSDDGGDYEWIITHYMKENALLEQKKQLLAREIFQQNFEYIQLQVDMAMQQLST